MKVISQRRVAQTMNFHKLSAISFTAAFHLREKKSHKSELQQDKGINQTTFDLWSVQHCNEHVLIEQPGHLYFTAEAEHISHITSGGDVTAEQSPILKWQVRLLKISSYLETITVCRL